MRIMLVTDQEKDLTALKSRLLSGRLGDARAASAMRALEDLNPHVDFRKLAAGTVLLVPDSPDFKRSASDSAAGDVVNDLQQLVRSGLEAAAAKLEEGNKERAAERAELTTVLARPAVKRALEADPEIKARLGEVAKRFKEEQRQAIEAERALEAATKGAMAELASLTRMLG
jgi:hypothetical protein